MQGPHLTNSQETFLANEILWTVREGRKTENLGLRCIGASSPIPFVCSPHTLTGAFQASPLVSACARARASLKFHPNVDVTRDD